MFDDFVDGGDRQQRKGAFNAAGPRLALRDEFTCDFLNCEHAEFLSLALCSEGRRALSFSAEHAPLSLRVGFRGELRFN